jgi:large subunit ribosomal protein L4
MITVPTYSTKGVEGEKMTLPEKVFGVEVNETLLAQAVRVYLSNQRSAHAKTKTRSEVEKTTAKMYKQKGTGRARHGAYSAPIFVGGGIALGPTGTQNYKMRMPVKMNRLAIVGALSDKAKEKAIVILTNADKAELKTKDAQTVLGKLGDAKKTLLVAAKEQTNIIRSWRNLKNVSVVCDEILNSYEIMVNKRLVMTEEVIANLKKKYAT